MVKYDCNICAKQFNHKGNYEKHINNAKPCKKTNPFQSKTNPFQSIPNPLFPKMDLNNDDTQCCCCLKIFSNKNNRIKHEKTSKCFYEKTKADDEKENMRIKLIEEKNRKLEEKLIELEQMIKQGINPVTTNTLTTSNNASHNASHNASSNNTLTSSNNTLTSSNNTSSNNTLTNSNNKITQNIVVNMYGKENLSHITDQKYICLMNRGLLCIPEYILLKHFSHEMPENSNVYNSDMKSKYLMVYDGHKWNVKNKKEFIENMCDSNCDELQEKFGEFIDAEKLPPKVIERFNTFVERFEEYDKQTKKYISKPSIIENVTAVLYDEREKPVIHKKTRKNLIVEGP